MEDKLEVLALQHWFLFGSINSNMDMKELISTMNKSVIIFKWFSRKLWVVIVLSNKCGPWKPEQLQKFKDHRAIDVIQRLYWLTLSMPGHYIADMSSIPKLDLWPLWSDSPFTVWRIILNLSKEVTWSVSQYK